MIFDAMWVMGGFTTADWTHGPWIVVVARAHSVRR